jgi:hypothetical protein
MDDDQDVREDVPPDADEETRQAEQDWEENEPSPHQGEAGQQESGG